MWEHKAVHPSTHSRGRSISLLVLGGTLLTTAGALAQGGTRTDPSTEELQRRLAAQTAATRSGDPAAVAAESPRLAALALRQLANLRMLEDARAQAAELYRESMRLESTPDTQIDLAVSLLRGKHIAEAVAQTDEVLTADPKNARAWQLKGSEEMAQEDYPGAVRSLSRSLDLATDVNALYALGFSLLKTHQPEKARVVFDQMLKLYGNKAIWHVVFGGAFRDTGYPDQAIEEFKRAIALDPMVGHAHFFLGLTYLQANHWGPNPQTLEQFNEAIRLEPRDFLVNFYLGALESTSNDLDLSNKHLHVAAELQPDSPETWLYLGLNAFQQHDNANAQKYLEKAIALTGTDEARNNYQIRRAYFVLGRIYVMEGRHDEGEKLLGRVKELQQKSLANSAETISDSMKEQGIGGAPAVLPQVPGSTGSQVMAEAEGSQTVDPAAEVDASALAQTKLTERQKQAIVEREKELRQILAAAFNDWGTAEARGGQYGPALAHFQEAERWDAGTPGLLRNIGIAAFRVGDFAESARALSLVSTAGTPDARSGIMLAMSYFSLGRFDDATKAFARVREAAMQDPRAAYAWAFSLARSGQQPEANRIVDTLAAQDLPPDVLALVCHVYTDTENYEHAISCFKKVYAEDPSIKKAHYAVASALIHLDRPSEAIPELQQEQKVSPQDPNVEYLTAYALLQTSHKEEATSLLWKVVGADPNHAEAQYQLGKLLLDDGKTAEAIEHLEAAEKNDPEPDYVHYQLQAAYRRAGRVADADRELRVYREIKEKRREITPQHGMASQ